MTKPRLLDLLIPFASRHTLGAALAPWEPPATRVSDHINRDLELMHIAASHIQELDRRLARLGRTHTSQQWFDAACGNGTLGGLRTVYPPRGHVLWRFAVWQVRSPYEIETSFGHNTPGPSKADVFDTVLAHAVARVLEHRGAQLTIYDTAPWACAYNFMLPCIDGVLSGDLRITHDGTDDEQRVLAALTACVVNEMPPQVSEYTAARLSGWRAVWCVLPDRRHGWLVRDRMLRQMQEDACVEESDAPSPYKRMPQTVLVNMTEDLGQYDDYWTAYCPRADDGNAAYVYLLPSERVCNEHPASVPRSAGDVPVGVWFEQNYRSRHELRVYGDYPSPRSKTMARDAELAQEREIRTAGTSQVWSCAVEYNGYSDEAPPRYARVCEVFPLLASYVVHTTSDDGSTTVTVDTTRGGRVWERYFCLEAGSMDVICDAASAGHIAFMRILRRVGHVEGGASPMDSSDTNEHSQRIGAAVLFDACWDTDICRVSVVGYSVPTLRGAEVSARFYVSDFASPLSPRPRLPDGTKLVGVWVPAAHNPYLGAWRGFACQMLLNTYAVHFANTTHPRQRQRQGSWQEPVTWPMAPHTGRTDWGETAYPVTWHNQAHVVFESAAHTPWAWLEPQDPRTLRRHNDAIGAVRVSAAMFGDTKEPNRPQRELDALTQNDYVAAGPHTRMCVREQPDTTGHYPYVTGTCNHVAQVTLWPEQSTPLFLAHCTEETRADGSVCSVYQGVHYERGVHFHAHLAVTATTLRWTISV